MGKALGSSTVTTRFQVTIPEKARKMLKIEEGDTIVFFEEDGKVNITTEVKVT
jgi:AbrB family looped-hinge helix DNA binding protein